MIAASPVLQVHMGPNQEALGAFKAFCHGLRERRVYVLRRDSTIERPILEAALIRTAWVPKASRRALPD